MNRLLVFISAFSILCTSCVTKVGETEKLRATVSIPPLQALVEEIGGDMVDVDCIVASNANPESFEPTMNNIAGLQKSNLFFCIGTLDFEKSLCRSLNSTNSLCDIVDTSKDVNLLYGTHGECEHNCEEHHHHSAEAPDPHIWSSLKNIGIMSSNIYKALLSKTQDESAKNIIEANYSKLKLRIDSLENIVSKQLSNSSKAKSFIVWHPSLSYFANDYGLNQIVVGSHGKELSVAKLRERLSDASVNETEVFFIQKDFDSRQAELLNNGLKAKIIEINPMNRNWEEEILKIADGLR